MELLKALEEGLRAHIEAEVANTLTSRVKALIAQEVAAQCGSIGKTFVIQDGEPLEARLHKVADDIATMWVTINGSMDSAGIDGRIGYLEERNRELTDTVHDLIERIVNPDIANHSAGDLESEVEQQRNLIEAQTKEMDGMKLRIDRLENRYQQMVSRTEFKEWEEDHMSCQHDDDDFNDKVERYLENSDAMQDAVKEIIGNEVTFEVRVS